MSGNSYSQIASSSLFPEIKSFNPAVIGQRQKGAVSVIGQMDKIEKEQDISPTYGSGAKGTSKIDINAFSFFYGGKGGGLVTSEFTYVGATGKKVDKLQSSQSTVEGSNDVSQSYTNLGLGIGKYLGLSAALLSFDYATKMSGNFGGAPFNSDLKQESDGTILKAGFHFNAGADFGFYYEQTDASFDITESGVTTSTKQTYKRVGLGVGASSKNFHFEISHEKDLDDNVVDGKTYKPTRTTAALEGRFGKISLGYIGSYYVDGLVDLEELLYFNLVYSKTIDEARLENIFNFSYGSDKGHSFSGSVGFSEVKSQEISALYGNGPKYDTTTTQTTYAIKYSYIF